MDSRTDITTLTATFGTALRKNLDKFIENAMWRVSRPTLQGKRLLLFLLESDGLFHGAQWVCDSKSKEENCQDRKSVNKKTSSFHICHLVQ
jgi:hypothetical protein